MKYIVGLGNPGEKYKNNRHNVGYMVVQKLQESKNPKLQAAKTNTFMNESGKFVKKVTSAYNLVPSALFIVHDDLDIKLGEYKIQFGRGPHDHNGLNSIYEELGSKDFWHIRVGVDNRNPENREKGEDYVLEDFSLEEKLVLKGVMAKIVRELATIKKEGVSE